MSTHRDSSPPPVKQESDDLDGDAHYHHRKHRHTHEQQTLTSPTQQHSNNGHNHSAAAAQWSSSTSPIQPIKRLDPLQAEVETLRKQNLQLQLEVAALQEKLKATSIHSPPNTSPVPLQHQPPPQHVAPLTTMQSPSPLPPATASTPPPALTSPSPQPQPQSAVTPVKEEAEVTQTANVEGRSSCHRCKSQKDNQQLMFCTYRGDEGKRTKVCRKKYCKNCLQRWHMPSDKAAAAGAAGGGGGGVAGASVTGSPVNGGATTVAVNGAVVCMGDEYEWWQPNNRLGWCCPACLGCCKCAACQRKYQWDVHVTTTAAAAGNGVAGEEEIRKDVMERLQDQSATRFRTLKASGALQRSPVSTTKERKIKPAPVTAATTPQQATQSPTLSSTSLHDSHDRDNMPAYALPSSSPALSVHSRSESSTSLSSLSHPLTAEQTRQLIVNLRQGTIGPAQMAQLQLSLESQLQQMGGSGSHYGSSDEEKGSPTHSPYPESERDSPLSRASHQSYQSHATTHSAHSGHSGHPYHYPPATHHSHPPPPGQQQPYHIAAISVPPSHQPQPPGLISPLSASGYEQGQYGYGQPAGSSGEPHRRSDSRGAGRKRSSGSGHDYVPAITAHAVPAIPAFHPPPPHSNQPAAYAAQPQSPAFAYPATPAAAHPSHQPYQPQQSTGGYSSQQQQPQQPYSAAKPSHSPQQSYARVTSPPTSHSQPQQHGPTQSQSHPQLSSVAHGSSAAGSAYGRESHTQNMHNMRDQVLATRQQQQPARSPSTATTVSPPSAPYPPPALSPTAYAGDPYYLTSPVASIPFPQLNPSSSYLSSPYSRTDNESIDSISDWPLSPGSLGALGSVEEGDVVTMMNESSVGGSGRGLGSVVGDDMQLSGMSLGATGTMPLSLRADTFTPPTQE